MRTDHILKKMLGKAKKNNNNFNTNIQKPKPIKTTTIANKPVHIFNNHPIPTKQQINKIYKKIPDDTNKPVQFMTREQYIKKYVANQEQQNGSPFTQEQKKEFLNHKKDKYSNIIGRYTTKNNPYYKPAVVVFNDPGNQKNIKGKKFDELAWHEYGHELAKNKAIKEIRKDNISIDNFSHNKFTPNIDKTKVAELTAAQKFGARNLQGLKKIGAGRDRDVYALDDDKVIKIAKNPGGLTQNQGERDIEYLGMGEQYEQGKDYVVMKKQKPLSKEGKKKLGQIRKVADEHTNTMSPSYRTDVAMELSKENNILDQTGIGTEILDFQPNPKEVFANRQWGEDEEGNLVLLDGGALQDNQSLSKFRVKDFEPTDWQSKEWQETQQERKQYKDKGTYNKEKKFERGFMQHEMEIPDEPLSDEYSKDMVKVRGDLFYFESKNKKIEKDDNSKDKKWTNMMTGGDRFKVKLISPYDIEFTEPEEEKDRYNIENIKKSGKIKKPITVWNKYDSDDYYELEDGHHRVIAARERGDELIRAIVFDNKESTLRYRKNNKLTPFTEDIKKDEYSEPLSDEYSKDMTPKEKRALLKKGQKYPIERTYDDMGRILTYIVRKNGYTYEFNTLDEARLMAWEPDELEEDEYSRNTTQSLWHAGDKPPSETLKEQGRVYGFSSKEYADGWKEKEGKQNIYQFLSDEYDLDDKTYVRDTPKGKKYSDNEYISRRVIREVKL